MQCVPLADDAATEVVSTTVGQPWSLAEIRAFAARTRGRLALLAKMSVGLWTKPVCEQVRVAQLAEEFDVDESDDNDEHDSIARAVGKTNTIVWQFIPPLVVFAKFAEVGDLFCRDQS